MAAITLHVLGEALDDSGFLNTNSMSAVGDLQFKSLMSNKGFSRTNKCHVHGLIKQYQTKGQKKQTNPWCCSHNPLQTPHTCSSSPSIAEVLWALTLWNSQQLYHHFSFYLTQHITGKQMQQVKFPQNILVERRSSYIKT
jgi:hypothetical protein